MHKIKYIILVILFILVGVISFSQTLPSVLPNPFSPSGFYRIGWIKADNGMIFPLVDTMYLPRYSGTTVMRPQDRKLYYYDSSALHWIQISVGAQLDTTSLSNRINLKLNISDTASMLSPYLRKIDTTNRWVQNVYSRNDSLFKLKNGTETFVHTFPTSGSGTVTSIGVSVPAAMSVTPSTITTSGTFNFSGAGLASQYVKGNFTLGTTDTSMIPNFFSKVRSEFSGSSPITYNSTTGIIGILNANSTGQKGAATFNNSDFTDNGSALISLAPIGSGGSCLNCQLTIDTKGRITSFADGSIFLLSNAPGAGDTLVVSGDTIKRIYASYGLISVPTANSITLKVDTSKIATQYNLSKFGLQDVITNNPNLTIDNTVKNNGTFIMASKNDSPMDSCDFYQAFFGAGIEQFSSQNRKSNISVSQNGADIFCYANGTFSGGELYLDTTGLLYYDNTVPRIGIRYDNTDTMGWCDSTLITKRYLNQRVNGLIVTANNGLTETGNNIQLGGTLVQNTTVNNSSFIATMTGANASETFLLQNTGSGRALEASSIDAPTIEGTSTNASVFSGVSTNGIPVSVTSTNNAAGQFSIIPSNTNSVITSLVLTRGSIGTASSGIGQRIDYYAQTSDGSSLLSNRLISKFTNNSTGFQSSQFIINGANVGSNIDLLTINGNGQHQLNQYTGTNFQTIDSSFNTLVVDASGNIYKRSGDVSITSPALPLNSIQYNKAGAFGGDSLQYYPSNNYTFSSKDFHIYGRQHTGFFQAADTATSSGYLWQLYPRKSSGTPGVWGTGSDTLQPFFSELNTYKYDNGYPENPVYTLVQFGRPGINKPMASIRLEQGFYGSTEYHVLSTVPRKMVGANEIRHQSFYISQDDGLGQLQYYISNNTWAESELGSNFLRQYAAMSPLGLSMTTFHNPSGSISITHGIIPANQTGVGMIADSLNQAASFYASGAVQTLYVGGAEIATDMVIGNPGTSSGDIRVYKFTRMQGKEFRVENLNNSTLGFSVTSNAIGFIKSIQTDASGFANETVTGTNFINRDAAISTSTRLLGIYNNYNPNDSIFHVYGNGNAYFKGVVTARADSTTNPTGGFVYRDAATGNFRLASNNVRYNHTIFTPSTGGTVNLVNGQYNIVNPSGTIATLTVNLPSSPANNDVVYIKYTQAVTTVTYGNGTVVDGITTPSAGGLVVLVYDQSNNSWY